MEHSGEDQIQWHGYAYAVGLFFAEATAVMFIQDCLNVEYVTGARLRTALTNALFRKVIRPIESPFRYELYASLIPTGCQKQHLALSSIDAIGNSTLKSC